VVILFFNSQAQALYTEIGASYVYKTSYVDNANNMQSQGITGSVSVYFWERVALEASYTNTLLLNQSQAVSATSPSVIYTRETDTSYGLDLIYVFADRKATFQPYVKGGVAYVTKTQNTQIDNNPQWTVGPYTGLAPEYGIGLKFLLTDAFAIRAGYDVQITPVGNSATAQDINGRVGLSWMF
jgi:outer membrane autotransporter protein